MSKFHCSFSFSQFLALVNWADDAESVVEAAWELVGLDEFLMENMRDIKISWARLKEEFEAAAKLDKEGLRALFVRILVEA